MIIKRIFMGFAILAFAALSGCAAGNQTPLESAAQDQVRQAHWENHQRATAIAQSQARHDSDFVRQRHY